MAADQFGSIEMGSQCLNIRQKYIGFILILQNNPVLQAAGVMAKVKFAGNPISCEYTFFHR
ncbi:hypothetical protein D3C71_2187620 [compost metagenome]